MLPFEYWSIHPESYFSACFASALPYAAGSAVLNVGVDGTGTPDVFAA
jgi:hypothetical protein